MAAAMFGCGGCSKRLLKDEQANFPKPVIVRRCRYFPLSEIEAWEASKRATSKQEQADAG